MALTARSAAVACLLLALAVSASAAGKGSHAPAPAPATDCYAAAAGLSDCLSYVTPGSPDKSPSKACCGEVKTAVADPATVDCLCQLAGSKNLPFPIDMKRVLALPAACGSSNTVFSKCNISGGGSPSEAPGASTGGSPSGGATASPPKAAASPRMTAATLMVAVVAPLLGFCLF